MAGFPASMTDAFRTRAAVFGAAAFFAALALPAAAQARGPEQISDVAEAVIEAVVNISTSQTLEAKNERPGGGNNERSERGGPTPQVPPGSQFEEFFEEFFKNRRGPNAERNTPRRVNSLGSGFIIDPSGIVVTNNHVISEADEVHVVFNDGSRLKAEIVGRDQKTDLAVLRVKPTKPLKAVKFGDSEKLRLGEWVIAIGNPFSLGGSVTAGIVSARNRDINSGPYDNYIQTDAAINRGNSGGPLFNLNGEVVGVNTAIYSPSGGSVGIGFAVPSKTVVPVINQLREFGETRRGWLGVRIQSVTDELAETLGLKGGARGALISGLDDKGPAKPAGIETGDVVVKFDGADIKEVKDLQLRVADTPVGKDVEIVVIRKGKEETKTVKVGRLEDGEKAQQVSARSTPQPEKPVVKKALGLDLANLDEALRKRYKIKDAVKGVVITAVEPASNAAEKRLSAGDVIVEVAREAVSSADDFQKKLDKLKKDGKKTALLLVANANGEERFVALSLQ
jgi:serine protease Do